MRILFVHNRYQQAGGEDRAVDLETRLLIEKGHAVKTLFFDNQGITDSLFQKLITLKNAIYNTASAKALKLAILEFRPDIIHVHNLFFVASPAILKEAARQFIPVVATLHNYRLICCNALLLRDNKPCEICIRKKLPLAGIRHACYRGSPVASAMVTLSTALPKFRNNWSKWVDQYIVLTEFSKKKFTSSSLGARPEQLIIKPNFVPDPGIGKSVRDPYFLYVGRISSEKGVQVLVKAFNDLPHIKVRIAGDGPDKASLMSDHPSAANIEFLGDCSHSEILELMKASMALILPSIWYEGLPYVMLEAFSTGTPVIASNLGAMASVIEDGKNGLVFAPGSVKELKSAILRFNENRGNNSVSKENMYALARGTYLKYFHPEIHYQSVIAIYDQSIRKIKNRTP